MIYKILKKKYNTGDIWFTSDTHFNHSQIIKYCDRPYENQNDMNEDMIARWNAIVKPEDTVFHLGDFAFTSNIDTIREIVSRLNGEIFLILGNHDIQNGFYRDSVREIFGERMRSLLDIQVWDDEQDDWQAITLCHFRMGTWHRSNKGAWNLFGHSHGTTEEKHCKPMQIDVGVDCHDMNPVSYDKVKEIITRRFMIHNKIRRSRFANWILTKLNFI